MDRKGWTKQQWADDAQRIMSHIDGAASALKNGHINGLLARIRELTPRTITTAAEADEVLDGTTVRGVTAGRSFYTLQFNDDGFWNQMGCDDEWDNDSLFPFFDHLEVIWEPTK